MTAAEPSPGPVEGSAVFPIGTRVNDLGRLEVGGCDVVELARQFGTPAYIYSEDDLRSRATAYVDALSGRTEDFEVVYASKAAPIGAILELFSEHGLSVDVASGGELHLALRAGFDPSAIYLHGNNKSEAELRLAVESSIGYVVLDSLAEIERLDRICSQVGRRQEVLIRVTPAVEPDTHAHVQTGQLDSKFGLGLGGGLAASAVEAVLGAANLRLVGLHAHIGSQIFELEPYVRAIEALGELADPQWCRLLNVGGGLAIAYTSEDSPPTIDEYVRVMVEGSPRSLRPDAADPDRARPIAGRQRRNHRLHRRDRQGDPRRADLRRRRRGHVRQPPTDALRLALRGDRRRPRLRADRHDRDDRGHALRIQRRDRP